LDPNKFKCSPGEY